MNPQDALLLVLGWLERAVAKKDQLKRERDLLLAAAKRASFILTHPCSEFTGDAVERLDEAIRKVEQNATGPTPQ